MEKRMYIGVYIFLIVYFSLFFAQKINLTTADLGRHITNGKVLFETGKIVSTNYYSYTQPDFPVVNHHWLSGAVFYLLEQSTGFVGLSIFYILLSGLTVFMAYKSGYGKPSALLAILCTLPLIAYRKEIRPEGFSYLFLILYYFILSKYKLKEISFKKVCLIILSLQFLWVNLHLFFIMGIFVIGVFMSVDFVEHWFFGKENHFRQLAILLFLSLLICLINPYHVNGLLEPLNIFREYEYMIIENQTVLFMQKRSANNIYLHFEIFSCLFILMSFHLLVKKKLVEMWPIFFVTLLFMILSFRAIRGIPMFGIFFAVFSSQYLYIFDRKQQPKYMILGVLFMICSFVPGHHYSLVRPAHGLGLWPEINYSVNFFIDNNIQGPVFNNYDVGGYLIYNLYGKEKVFVDNRPEAYSAEFFKEMYIPMQEREEVWEKIDLQYKFNVIYFYRHDATPWAQPFLVRRVLSDVNWVPVYVDNFVIILVRNSEENKDIIEKYALPEQMFSSSR